MIKVFFHVEIDSGLKINFNELKLGNPGMGGTPYITLSLAFELANKGAFQVGIISAEEIEVPKNILFSKQLNLIESLKFAEEQDAVLVFRPTFKLNPDLNKALSISRAKTVAWAHVNPSQETLRNLAMHSSVKRVIALGKRQYFTWIDNPVSNKATIIQNAQYLQKQKRERFEAAQYISYLGALVPQKGFHLLAKIWPEIHKEFPNLRLKVIGSGSLYSANSKLGLKGIAADSYENLIFEHLGDSADSVEFLGTIGGEVKNEVVRNSYIGIVNPSGLTENCPGSALEFQVFHVPVVTVRKLGLIDTVQHMKTGLLERNYKKLPKAISKLVNNPNQRDSLSSNCFDFVERNFNFPLILNQWEEMLASIDQENKKPKIHFTEATSAKELFSWLYSRITHLAAHVTQLPTTLEIESSVRTVIRRIIKRS